ncbi:MAG: hypothetical protein AB8F26_00965 [Phycisphaerales bacterium]
MSGLRRHIEFLAVWLFCAGFVLVGSNWGPALSRMLDAGPSWSVCGQAMCDCRPVDSPDDCPLCLAGISMPGEPAPGCSKGLQKVDPTRLLIRRTNSEAALTRLDSAGQVLLVGCFLIGLRAVDGPAAAEPSAMVTLRSWTLPASMAGEVPTPPPRG